jgi:hypothetical protein
MATRRFIATVRRGQPRFGMRIGQMQIILDDDLAFLVRHHSREQLESDIMLAATYIIGGQSVCDAVGETLVKENR